MDNQNGTTAGDFIWTEQRKGPKDVSLTPAALQKKAVIQAIIGASLGALIYVFWSHIIAYIAFSITGLSLVAAFVSPTVAYVKILAFVGWLGLTIGRIVTFVLLVPLYFLFFLPFGLFFRQGGNDKMDRHFDASQTSYWGDLSVDGAQSKDYTKQY